MIAPAARGQKSQAEATGAAAALGTAVRCRFASGEEGVLRVHSAPIKSTHRLLGSSALQPLLYRIVVHVFVQICLFSRVKLNQSP